MYEYTSKMKMMKQTGDDENDGNESDDENLRLSSRGVEPKTEPKMNCVNCLSSLEKIPSSFLTKSKRGRERERE